MFYLSVFVALLLWFPAIGMVVVPSYQYASVWSSWVEWNLLGHALSQNHEGDDSPGLAFTCQGALCDWKPLVLGIKS